MEMANEKRTQFFKFERMDVWKRALDWANDVFDVCDALPQKYQFSLGEQLRRASLSVPTNIAEGIGREKIKERHYFYRIAKGSIYEVVSLLVMCGRRGHLKRETYRTLYAEANELAAILTHMSKPRSPISSFFLFLISLFQTS